MFADCQNKIIKLVRLLNKQPTGKVGVSWPNLILDSFENLKIFAEICNKQSVCLTLKNANKYQCVNKITSN